MYWHRTTAHTQAYQLVNRPIIHVLRMLQLVLVGINARIVHRCDAHGKCRMRKRLQRCFHFFLTFNKKVSYPPGDY